MGRLTPSWARLSLGGTFCVKVCVSFVIYIYIYFYITYYSLIQTIFSKPTPQDHYMFRIVYSELNLHLPRFLERGCPPKYVRSSQHLKLQENSHDPVMQPGVSRIYGFNNTGSLELATDFVLFLKVSFFGFTLS